jgi:NADH-quinone oxidoreductase subunit D
MTTTRESERFTISIGPQHPALKEPGSFQFTVDGEIVTNAYVRLGYAHRGIEKAAEQRNWVQDLYLLERICGICSHIHATAFSLAVEQLAHVEAPPRAQAIRVMVAELERIHSHFLWIGVSAHEAGFDTLFMYSWRDRETVMDMLEKLTGNRVNYSANVLGGVKCDVDEDQTDSLLKGIDFLEERTHHYFDVLSKDAMFLQRTRGIAVMSRGQAEVMGALGPTARASNVARDVRVESPYAAYKQYPVNMALDTRGDLEARFVVRVKELFESFRVIRQILATLPEGELSVRLPRRIPAGEVVIRVEAPRGELFYFVKSNGTDKPERVKVRTPTICNMTSVIKLAVGNQLADVPMILAGIDPCFSCNDRTVQLTQTKSGNSEMLTWEELRSYGIEYYKRMAR